MKRITKLLSLTAAPCIAILASCASSGTAVPTAHLHGDLVHSHATAEVGNDLINKSAQTTYVYVGSRKVVVPVTPAKPSEIKPLGLKGILHKHHTHVAPKTAAESVPC